ncbi:MAG: TrkH family potassium uptake protein, partial [Spirochaetaceae bacterium]|nr:TrkH family potassium uptake protein [Spirochaetaceae bacterium]
MKFKAILKLLTLLLLVLSFFLLVCAASSLYFKEGPRELRSFLIPAGLCVAAFILVFSLTPGRERPYFSAKSGYLFVSLAWVTASGIGALPFLLSGVAGSYTDAFFETMSGFTTTGASILADVEIVPRSILLWRSTTHWLGGMGIVVLTVAIFPLLGLGGLQLVEAEAPGPSVDKITPRMAGTAKILWFIYVLFTIAEILLLVLGGMGLFDAVTHTFGTVATGGFSTKNLSVGHFANPFIDVVITVFMVLSGMNFALFYKVGKGRLREAFADSEMRAYVGVFLAASLLIALDLSRNGVFASFRESFRHGAFQSASILTTTGYATTDFDLWPPFSRVVLFALMFIGGCAGSTGGGVKVVRYLVLLKQSAVELKYLVFPRGVFAVRLNGEPVRNMVVFDTASFFFMYFITAMACTLVVASAGYGIETALTATLATLGNIGPGLAL